MNYFNYEKGRFDIKKICADLDKVKELIKNNEITECAEILNAITHDINDVIELANRF